MFWVHVRTLFLCSKLAPVGPRHLEGIELLAGRPSRAQPPLVWLQPNNPAIHFARQPRKAALPLGTDNRRDDGVKVAGF